MSDVERSDEQDGIIDLVERELRPGGKPAAKYRELEAADKLFAADAARLTGDMFESYERRLCVLERALGGSLGLSL